MCVLNRTFHYQMSQPGWLPEPTLSSSFFPSRSSISTPSPFLSSTSVRAAKKGGESSTNCLGPQCGVRPLPHSLSLPSFFLSPSLLPLLWQSTPAWSWLHALWVQLPRSHFSLIPPTGFLGVDLTSSLFALILLRTGRKTLVPWVSLHHMQLSFCNLTVVSYWWHHLHTFLPFKPLHTLDMLASLVPTALQRGTTMFNPICTQLSDRGQRRGRGGVVAQLMLVPRCSANQTYSCGFFWKVSAFKAPGCAWQTRWLSLSCCFFRWGAFLRVIWCFGKLISEVSVRSEQGGRIFRRKTRSFKLICSISPFI